MERNGILLALFTASVAGCANEQMAIDPDFAARAESFRAALENDAKAPLVAFGPFTVETLAPVTSSKVVSEDKPTFANHRFSFELRDKGDADWVVACEVRVKWISKDRDDAVQELDCDLHEEGAEGQVPHKLSVSGLGPVLGLKTGALTLGQPILDISSAHAAAAPPRSIGRLLGFEITQNHIVLGTVQTVSPVTIWLDRSKPERMQALAAACAVALAYYENMARDA